MRRDIRMPVNEDGDVIAWKAIVGGRSSHKMARPIFPRHQPNYDFDHGLLIRIKAFYRQTGPVPLEDEFSKRK